MADDSATRDPKAPGSGASSSGSERTRGLRSVLLWAGLVTLALAVGIQSAGLLLRDHLEGRRPIASQPPPIETPELAQLPQGSAESRFGPDVREVVVASADPKREAAEPPSEPTEDADAPEPAPERPSPPMSREESSAAIPKAEVPSPPESDAPSGVASVSPSPAPPKEEKQEAGAPEPAKAEGTHALQMGVFRSQRYRSGLERKIVAMGLPSFRSEKSRNGVGYRLVIPADTPSERSQAQTVLEAAGYAFRNTDGEIEVFFHVEREAQKALDMLSQEGLKGAYTRFEGPQPVWTVYAGPFSVDEAQRVQERLTEDGIETFLRRRPW